MIKKVLTDIGLTVNEIEIYMALLRHGEISVNEVGVRSGLHRQVCYDALERLLEKGFVSFVHKDGKKFFSALEPDKILEYIEAKKSELAKQKKKAESILPELNALFKNREEETHVEVVKGKKVLRTVLSDIISTLKEKGTGLCAMGIDEKRYLDFDEMAIKQYIYRMRRHNLRESLLAKEGSKRYFSGSQSEYRLIPEHLFNPNPTHIYGDKVAFIIWGDPAYGIIIKNSEVADSNRKYFKMLWRIAKKK